MPLAAIHSSADSHPLDRFPVTRTSDPEIMRHALVSTFGARHFDLAQKDERLDACANHWQSRRIGLSYCSYGAEVEVDFPPADFVRQQYSLQGGAEIRTGKCGRQITPRETSVVAAGCDLRIFFSPRYEQIVLRIDEKSLRGLAGALTGDASNRALVFDATTPLDTLLGASLQRTLAYFVTELSRGEMIGAPIAQAELEQMLMVSFLACNRNSFTTMLQAPPGRPASWQLRQAEEFIAAHWNQPLSVEAICLATGLSARTIFHHFRNQRGMSPMAFLKQVRLVKARDMLRDADVASVTAVAYACGFGNLGHFSRDYARHFGEKPSDTIRLRGVGRIPRGR